MLSTTVVGSYPIPGWVKTNPSPEAMRDAVRLVVRIQEQAGIDVVSDGELSRWNFREHRPSGMVERFVTHMTGINDVPSAAQRRAFQQRSDVAYRGLPAGVVVGELGAGTLDLERDWRQSADYASHPLKFTVTSPYMMAKLVHDEWYRDFEQLVACIADVLAEQLAGVGAAVVQIDEPNLPGSPDDARLAAGAINRVLDGVQGAKAVHLCFGNFGGQRIQQGHYGSLLEFFNRLECEQLVLETTRRPTEELELLRDVKSSIAFSLGVIDVKDLQVEDPAHVARRIEGLAQMVGVDRMGAVCPDCGLAQLPRDVADRKLAALVSGRDLFLGRRRRE